MAGFLGFLPQMQFGGMLGQQGGNHANMFTPNAMLGAGMGLLSGRNWQEGMAGALPAMMSGAALDRKTADAAENKKLLGTALSKYGIDPSFAGNDDVAKLMLAQAMKPKDSKVTEVDGALVDYTDPQNPRVLYQGNKASKPSFGIVGEDAAGNKQYGFIDAGRGAVTPYTPQGGQPGMSKLDLEVSARKRQAEGLGLKPDDPRYETFVLTGKMPREDAQPLTATDKKAILEADEMVASNRAAIQALKEARGLSGKANAGWLAGTRASVGANLPDLLVPDAISSPESSEATINYDNAVIGQALMQLKSIFGAAPTEGERKILLDLQGSASQPRAVREQILDRAKRAAEARLKFNEDRARSLRSQDFYKPGASGAPQPATSGGYRVLGVE